MFGPSQAAAGRSAAASEFLPAVSQKEQLRYMTEVPLRRNRDFLLLQAGQLFSNAGTATTTVAYPLLVLATAHSAALAGFVTFMRTLPAVLFSLPGGVAADRFDRKMLMIVSDACRAAAVGSLGVAILSGHFASWQIPVVAFAEGSFAALFGPAAAGTLRSVVPPRQLPAAVAGQTGRLAAANLAGPPLGGALFGLSRALPFAADAASYTCSLVSLIMMGTPFQEPRPGSGKGLALRAQLAEGFGFLWSEPFLRTTTFLYGLTNFIGPGLLLAIVVIGARQGLPSWAIGALTAAFGACVLAGSLAAGFARRVLPARMLMLVELWAWLCPAAFLIWPNVYVLAASVLPAALAIPLTDSVVIGYRLAITPDRLVGRVESVRSNIALGLAPFGPLAAGLLLSAAPARLAISAFAAVALVLALWGTLSPAIRSRPGAQFAAGA
jgi:transmembrane secretion effector